MADADLDAAIRADLDRRRDQLVNIHDPYTAIAFEGMWSAITAVLDLKRRNGEDWTHVSETAYEAGRRWALEQAVDEIAEALGIAGVGRG